MPTRHLEPDDRAPRFLDSEVVRFFGDAEFDQAYPEPVQELSRIHWTPVEVGRQAARFLVTQPGTRVLDIGCGPGKFCAIGAATTEGHFTGVEQRERLVATARRMLRSYRIPRVEIIHANVMDVSFQMFDAFYIYNPFQENVFPTLCIDSDVELQPELYSTYSDYVCEQLSLAPIGTRVVTYWGNCAEIPLGYVCKRVAYDEKLRFWIKRRNAPAVLSAEAALDSLRDRISMGACGLGYA
jgi:SAM-dependent methyltransferase